MQRQAGVCSSESRPIFIPLSRKAAILTSFDGIIWMIEFICHL